MARSTHPTHGLQAYILILAMTTIVTVFSASMIHGGVRDLPLGIVQADAAPVAQAHAVLYRASDTLHIDLKEVTARDLERVPTPIATERQDDRGRFVAEAVGQARNGTLSFPRGSNYSDTRVFLLEATAHLRDRGAREEPLDVVSNSIRFMTDN